MVPRTRLLAFIERGRLLRVVVLVACCVCLGAEHNHRLDIGDPAPFWENLPGIDDKQHALSDYDDQQVIVAVFTCNTCPVAIDYEDRLIALQEEYGDKGVQMIAINVNTTEGNQFKAMKQRATTKAFNFPYLFDASQASGRSYGATVTPHVFVLDENRDVVYMGSVDDHRNEARVRKHHLREALDALLAGNMPVVPETRQFGCGIKYNN